MLIYRQKIIQKYMDKTKRGNKYDKYSEHQRINKIQTVNKFLSKHKSKFFQQKLFKTTSKSCQLTGQSTKPSWPQTVDQPSSYIFMRITLSRTVVHYFLQDLSRSGVNKKISTLCKITSGLGQNELSYMKQSTNSSKGVKPVLNVPFTRPLLRQFYESQKMFRNLIIDFATVDNSANK